MHLRIERIPLLTLLVPILLTTFGCGDDDLPNPSGTLEATEVDIAATISGRTLRVLPQLGSRVSQGDTLVVIDTEVIALQRAQAEAGLASIDAQREVFRDNISQAKRNFEFLSLQFNRISELVRQGTAQQQQLDEIATKKDVGEEQVRSAGHQFAALDAEESKVKATLAIFDRQIKEGTILAPFAGDVLLRAIEPGEVTTPGKVLFTLADMSKMELRVFIGAADLELVKIGATIPVLIDAIPNRKFSGTVAWISSEAEFTPKNAQTKDARLQLVYAVKILIENPDGSLRIGMPGEAVL